MSNDKKIEELSRKLTVKLNYSDKIDKKEKFEPNLENLKKLTKDIRKNLEDYSVETASCAVVSKRLK